MTCNPSAQSWAGQRLLKSYEICLAILLVADASGGVFYRRGADAIDVGRLLVGRTILGGKMKAIIEFNLPDEEVEFDDAKNGVNYKAALSEFATELRNRRNYSEKQPTSYEIWDMFWAVMESYKIDLNY